MFIFFKLNIIPTMRVVKPGVRINEQAVGSKINEQAVGSRINEQDVGLRINKQAVGIRNKL